MKLNTHAERGTQPSPWRTFVLVAVAQFMVVLDVSITNVALPAIQRSLHFSTSSLQWIITAYALTFGGFLLLGGRAADLFGRRRMLIIGMGGFTLFSLLIGIGQSAIMVVALRSLQGLAAAFMSPAALSIVLTTFQEGRDRNRALGFWAIVSTGGAAVGLLLGGVLTQFVGWRWNFFVNVPVGLIMAIAISRYVPKHEQEETQRTLDLPGALLVTTGLIALVYAITRAPIAGWLAPSTLGILTIAAALLGAFFYNESRSSHPLMPLSIFKVRNLSGGNLIMAPVYAGMMGTFFLLSLYVQAVLHYGPALGGLSFLPFPITLAIVASQVAKLVTRYGYKPFLVAGPVVAGSAMLMLTQLTATSSYLTHVLPLMILMPLGMGMTFMPTYAAATSGVPAHKSGLASGLINTSQQLGGALGLAVLAGIAAATATAAHSAPLVALVQGFDRAFLVGSSLMFIAAFLAATIIKQPRPATANTSKAEDPRPSAATQQQASGSRYVAPDRNQN